MGAMAGTDATPSGRGRPEGGWRIVEAEFRTSAADASGWPPPREVAGAPVREVAFAGRSNVGKSSLVNALVGRRGLARVSRTPGRTQLINFFDVRIAGPDGRPREVGFVDLPGYGFAAAAAQVRQRWGPMIEEYIAGRDPLAALVLLVDVRRGVGDLDRSLLELASAHGHPSLLVATKADKIGASARGLARRKIAAPVGARAQDVVLTSASSGLGLWGADGLVRDIVELTADATESESQPAPHDTAPRDPAEDAADEEGPDG